MQVNPARDLWRRVPQQGLNRTERRAHGIKQRRVHMAQSVPSHLWNLELFAYWIKLAIPEISTTQGVPWLVWKTSVSGASASALKPDKI